MLKKVWLLVDVAVDNRFTLPEVKYHLQKALDNYINNLGYEDDMGIELGEVMLLDVDPRKVPRGNTQG
jgi:hypothetical protein